MDRLVTNVRCEYCKRVLVECVEQCPACGRQARVPPNVCMALGARPQLLKRFDQATIYLGQDKARAVAALVGRVGRVVVNMRFSTLISLLQNPHQTYGNFWRDIEAGSIVDRDPIATGDRMAVDGQLFGHSARKIRFALLSCDGLGASFYGRYSVTLDVSRVAARTSLLERNPFTVGLARVRKLQRATWRDRGRLAAWRYRRRLKSNRSHREAIRVRASTRANQDFIEAHIWDTFTRDAISAVLIQVRARTAEERADDARIEHACIAAGIRFRRPDA